MRIINLLKQGICLFLPFIVLNCSSQQRTQVPKEQPSKLYKGKVKKIITYSCQSYLQDGENIKILANGCNIQKYEEFNEQETVIAESKFDNTNDPKVETYRMTTRRDDKGNIIEKTEVSNYIFKDVIRHEYKYNENGYLIEDTKYLDNKLYTRDTYLYDEYNCLIEENYFDKSNQLKYKYISIYNNDNLITRRTGYDSKGDISSYIIYDYDKKGKLITEKHYDWNKKLTDETDYQDKPTDKRDSRNNLLEYIDYDGVLHLRKFDGFNNCTEEQLQKDGKWLETKTWTYRDDGALIEESFSTSRISGESYHKVTTKYKLDNLGNWIEKYSINNEDKSIVGLGARYIEYYNN
jgi:hypothetical protein